MGLSAHTKGILTPTTISKKQLLATYQLAWIICQKKHPFAAAEDFMEFARLADPDSPVFASAPDSRRTITRRIEDIADILRAVGRLLRVRGPSRGVGGHAPPKNFWSPTSGMWLWLVLALIFSS